MTPTPGDNRELRVSSRARPASPRLREAFTFLSVAPGQCLRAGLTTCACDASVRAMRSPESTHTAAGGARPRTSEPVIALVDHTAADLARAMRAAPPRASRTAKGIGPESDGVGQFPHTAGASPMGSTPLQEPGTAQGVGRNHAELSSSVQRRAPSHAFVRAARGTGVDRNHAGLSNSVRQRPRVRGEPRRRNARARRREADRDEDAWAAPPQNDRQPAITASRSMPT